MGNIVPTARFCANYRDDSFGNKENVKRECTNTDDSNYIQKMHYIDGILRVSYTVIDGTWMDCKSWFADGKPNFGNDLFFAICHNCSNFAQDP